MSGKKTVNVRLTDRKFFITSVTANELLVHPVNVQYEKLDLTEVYTTTSDGYDGSSIVVVGRSFTEIDQPLSVPVEVYLMDNRPASNSSLVVDRTKAIMQDLDLKVMITNLENCADLLFLAFNALAGFEVQAKMSGLQKTLLDLCDDCIVTVQVFIEKSNEVLNYIIKTYKMLDRDDPKEAIALKNLVRAGQRAAEMSDEAEALAERFKTLSGQCQAVHEETIVTEVKENERLEQLKRDLDEYNAKIAKNEVMKKELTTQIEEVNDLYEEAKQLEADEREKQFILGMTGAIAGALSMGLGAAIAVSNPKPQLNISNVTTQPSTSPDNGEKPKKQVDLPPEIKEQQKEVTQKANEYTAANTEYQKSVTVYERATKKYETLSKKKPPTDETDLAEYNKALERAENELEEAKLDMDEKKRIADDLKDSSIQLKAGLEASLKAIGASFDKMSDQAGVVMNQAHSEKLEFLQQKRALQKQQTETLADLAEFTVKVQTNEVQQNNAKFAVESLHTAIKCLAKIVTSLQDCALFWRQMAKACDQLTKSKTWESIDDFKDEDPEDRLEEYRSADFMYTLMIYIAGWAALNDICVDYLRAVNNTRGAVVQNINSAPSIEEARRNIPGLATKIGMSFNAQLEEAVSNEEELDKEIAEHDSVLELNKSSETL